MYPVSQPARETRSALLMAIGGYARRALPVLAALMTILFTVPAFAQGDAAPHAGGEADLVVPDLASVSFFGMTGHNLLLGGIFISVLGMGFGMWMYTSLKN